MPLDYSGQNLQGRSFKGQKLEGANFSYTDIRSANFTGANLIGVNFKNAEAGLQRRWYFLHVLLSWLLAVISGIISADGSLYVLLIFSDDLKNRITGWVAFITSIIFFATIIRKGINAAFAVAVVGAAVGAAALGVPTITVPLVVVGVSALAVAVAVVGGVARDRVHIGAVGVGFTVALSVVLAVAVAVLGGAAGARVHIKPVALAVALGGGAVIFSLLSIYIARQALKGDEKYSILRTIAIAFAAFGGTSFRNADLTDADFTGASLKSTDFRKANLTHTCFGQVRKLSSVRPGTTYLQYASLQQVLIVGQGQDKNFDRFDLRGVNLRGANLTDASFTAADLSNACFQDTDLSRAKLVQAQLDGTDFTGASLTGAYIEDWNITRETKFDGVRCECVYMRLPTKENPDPLRKPDNNKEVFADGEFGDFIKPIFDTLDLYHNQGVDPRAIAVAFKELAENNPDAELEIVAIERRGEDKILLRAKTTATANKSELSKEYFINYNQLKELAEKDFQVLIAAKESQIMRLENMVLTALERPNFYAETVQHQGDIVSQKSETSNYDLQSAKFGGGFAGTGGNQTGGTIQENSSNQNLQAQSQTLINNQIICTQCDRPNPNTFKFCIKCGAKLILPT